MQSWEIVLEYLRVFLSSQVVVGVVAIVFIVLFRVQIRGLIERIATIRVPGGELTMTQSSKLTAEAARPEELPEVSRQEVATVPASMQLTPEQQTQIQELFQAERARAFLWEYRYLNYFLVRHTQEVLDWLAQLQTRPTEQLFDSVWLPRIPSPNERQAVLDALQQHQLIFVENGLIEVTPKGHEYRGWRGPLPPLAG